MHPDNRDVPVPLVLTGPDSAADYFQLVDDFIATTLGEEARQFYQIEIGDPARVAQIMAQGVNTVREVRHAARDAFYFNWRLHIEHGFQQPFEPTHESMSALKLHLDRGTHELAFDLRRAFSGFVAGNVKEQGLRAIEQHGPFEVSGDKRLLTAMDELLATFVAQGRMKLAGESYKPCYILKR